MPWSLVETLPDRVVSAVVSGAGDEHKELMRKDIIDLKRAMNDEIHEKEATQKAANDLRNMVKKAEAEKIELNRSLQDAGQKIAGLWRHLLPQAHGPFSSN